MNLNLIYYAMLAAFFAHEIDAAKRHEWRILPLTSFLPDRIGEQVFIWAHLPLFLAIFQFSEGASVNGFRLGLSWFAIAHVGLHWLFWKHPANEFNNPSSWGLIILTGVLGAAFIVGSQFAQSGT